MVEHETGKHPHYWKVKAAFLQRQLTIAEANAALGQVMRSAGLDPSKLYELKDDGETITLKTE